jgi:hypothetical protein
MSCFIQKCVLEFWLQTEINIPKIVGWDYGLSGMYWSSLVEAVLEYMRMEIHIPNEQLSVDE